MQETTFNIVDRTSMHLYYDKLYTTRKRRPPLSAFILLTDLKVEDLPIIVAKREKLSKSYSVDVEALKEALYRVSLQRKMGLREIRREFIIDAALKGVWIVLTDAESYFVAHVLERFFEKLYPLVSRLYLNYSQMRALLRIIRESCHGKTTLTYFTIKRERSKPLEEGLFQRKMGTQILWDENVDEDIKRLLSDDFMVNVGRLDFVLKDRNDAFLLKAQITRKGLSKLKFGSFSAFYKNVVRNAIEYGLDRKDFYDKRERNIEEGVVRLRPLKIDYSADFRSEQLNRFAKKLSSSYSCSIIHAGNPYFMADLCDCEDGSSFSIAVLGNSITVTPFARGTSSAVWRLLDRIQEIMGDGEISDIRVG